MAVENLTTISFNTEQHSPATIVKWNVNAGSAISKGTILFTYNWGDVSTHFKYKSNNVGTVKTILKSVGQSIQNGDNLFVIENCLHPIVMKEMCAECGLDLKEGIQRSEQSYSASVAMVHSIPDLKVSQEQAHIIGKADEEHLIRTRKLALLVDLDQTLIHTTNDNIPIDIKDVHHFQLYGPKSQWYHTRLRPGTRQFLKSISELYELHICTFGARPYAHRIAEILDEDCRLFSKRILSRDECFNPLSKTANLKALFPCGDSMVCIIDDREDVWNYAPNLIHVKPYHFFQHTGDINAPPGLTKTEQDTDEPNFVIGKGITEQSVNSNNKTEEVPSQDTEIDTNEELSKQDPKSQPKTVEYQDDDDHLLHLEDKLRQIHRSYYEKFDEMKKDRINEIPDIKYIIPCVRGTVLQNVNIVFSGVIPTNMHQEKSRAWIMAKSLGASIQTNLIPATKQDGNNPTTHLIAARMGTMKVNEAKRLKSIFIVNPDWLWCCAERWEKVDEDLFPLTKADSLSVQTAKNFRDLGATFDLDPTRDKSKDFTQQFSTTINPLMSFTSDDIKEMDQEVEDIINEDEDEEEEEEDDDEVETEEGKTKRVSFKRPSSNCESNNDSLSEDFPKGLYPGTKKIKLDEENNLSEFPKEFLQDDSDVSDNENSDDELNESIGSVDEEMAAAVEREFLAP